MKKLRDIWFIVIVFIALLTFDAVNTVALGLRQCKNEPTYFMDEFGNGYCFSAREHLDYMMSSNYFCMPMQWRI